MNNKNEISLLMCATPLQMLIAEKIIKLNEEKSFDLVVLAPNNNNKYDYYYQKLKALCVDSIFYVHEKLNTTSFLNYKKKLQQANINKKYSNVYLSNIDFRHFQYFITKNIQAKIYTFDDGVGNITPNSFNNDKLQSANRLKRTLWSLLGVQHYASYIAEHSTLHYTLFKDIPNIVSPTHYIPLYSDINKRENSRIKVAKFYLGQPMMEIDSRYSSEYINKILETLDIDFYIPHPREKHDIKGVSIINSNLISEDYLINFLDKNPDFRIEIYSFNTTTSLNLANIKNIECFYIHDDFLLNNFNYFYKLASDTFNIKTIKVDLF